jgi:hypothetical protein
MELKLGIKMNQKPYSKTKSWGFDFCDKSGNKIQENEKKVQEQKERIHSSLDEKLRKNFTSTIGNY